MSPRLLALLLPLLPAAAAADVPRVVICLEEAAAERAGAEAVDRWVATVEIELAPPPCPAPAPGLLVGRFVERRGRIFFQLEGAGTPSLERAVPWLSSAVRPLGSLNERGRTSEFSVVVEALIAEHQLALLWGAMDLPVEAPQEAERPPPAAVAPKDQQGDGGFRRIAKGERGKPGRQKPGSTGRGAGKQPGGRPAAGGPGSAEAKAGPSGASGAAASVAPVEAAPAAPPIAAPAPPAEPPAVPAPPAAAAEPAPSASGTMAAVTLRPDPPRLPGIEEAAAAARRPVLDFRAPEPGGLPFRVSAAGGLRLRSPGVAAPEVGLELELGAAWLRAAWQPRVEWDLGGYPVAVEGHSVEGGLRLLLLSGRLWGLRGHAGVAVDRTELTPLYRPGAAGSPGWDVGPTAGVSLGWMPLPGLELGLGAAAQWMPTAGITHVGELGPSARFNAVGARLGLELAWRR